MLDGAHALQEIADKLEMPLTHMAINWVTQQTDADSILLGPSSAEQLVDCLAADDCDIPASVMEEIEAFLVDFDGTDATYAR